jgi:hypothetical protein
LILGALILAVGCGDKREAHLERFMQPEDAQEAAKLETLDTFGLAEDLKIADRINLMSFSEVAERIGAHRCQLETRFSFSSQKTSESLKESAVIVVAQNKDFKTKLKNDADQGYELVYSSGKLFIKNLYGKFHPRSILDQDHIKWRDSAYTGWASIYQLFRGRLVFTKVGIKNQHGRDTVEYSIRLGKNQPRLAGTPEPLAVPEGVSKYVYEIIPTPADADRYRDKAEAKKAKGTLLVDVESGAILGLKFSGELTLPPPLADVEGVHGDQISLTVSATINSDGFGNPQNIPRPSKESITPLPERIPVDTHPVDFFFGKGYTSSLGPAAGVAAVKDDKKKSNKDKPSSSDEAGAKTGGSRSKP